MKKTGEILRKNLGLEKFKYVKIARALISSYKILFVWYDSRRPTVPLTTHRIRKFPWTTMIFSGTDIFHNTKNGTTFAPPVPIQDFNGMLRGALIITVDMVGNNLIDTRIFSKKFRDSKIRYYQYKEELKEVKKLILEKTFDIKQQDIDLIQQPFKVFINELKNKGDNDINVSHAVDAIMGRNDWQFKKFSSGDLISKDCKAAHAINPINIEVGIFSGGNYYQPSVNLISISINYNFMYLLFQAIGTVYKTLTYPLDFEKLLQNTTVPNIERALTEITPLKWEDSISHEIAHWLDDTLHSSHLDKTLNKSASELKTYYDVENINVSHMEIEAQIHSIKILKNKFANVWDNFTIYDVLNKDTSTRQVYKNLSYDERKIWIDRLLKRMAREKLLGRNMSYVPADDSILLEALTEVQVNYIKPSYQGTILEIVKQVLEQNENFEIKELKEDLLDVLYEYTIADLRKNAPNPHEKSFLKTRQKKGEQGSFLTDLSWNDKNKRATGKEKNTSTLTLTFKIQPTYKSSQGNYTQKGIQTGTKKNYQVKAQFQAINDWVESRQAFLELTKGEQVEFIRGVIKGADVKIWSDDPSWLLQGHYENAVELDYSLYNWPSSIPRAKGRWAKIKTGSTTTPYFSLSKHMIEVLTVIPFIPDEIAGMIRSNYDKT